MMMEEEGEEGEVAGVVQQQRTADKVDSLVTYFIEACASIHNGTENKIENAMFVYKSESAYGEQCARRVDELHNALAFKICDATCQYALECNGDLALLQASEVFSTFLTVDEVSLPSNRTHSFEALSQFIEGQRRRFSVEVTLSRVQREIDAEYRRIVAQPHLLEKNLQLESLWDEYADVLSMSDHSPVRCTIASADHSTAIVSAWNVQEFVRDGLNTYVAAILTTHTERKGKTRWLLDAMMSPLVREHHCERVLRVVRRELEEGGAACMCLQEVDDCVLDALQNRTGYNVHVCQPFQAALSFGQCSATTCIVFRQDASNRWEARSDIVVATDTKSSCPRRFARVTIGDVTFVSVHVRHVKPEKGSGGFKSAGVTPHMERAEAQLLAAILTDDAEGSATSMTVAAGDWNGTHHPECRPEHVGNGWSCTRATAKEPTQYGNDFPIDGIMVFAKSDDVDVVVDVVPQ